MDSTLVVKTTRHKNIVLFCIFVLPLFVLAIRFGWRPLGAWQSSLIEQSGDPDNIVRRSLLVSETWNLFATVDPPFRYLPLAVIFSIVNPSTEAATRITHIYTTMTGFVVLPISVSVLFWRVVEWRVAFLTLLGFTTWIVLGVTENTYYDGFWHYTYVLPIVFLTLLSLHETVSGNRVRNSVLLAILTGSGVGIIGLNQYVYGALIAVTVTIVFLYHSQLRELLVAGVTGSLWGCVLLFSPQETREYVSSAGSSRLGVENWSTTTLLDGFSDILTTPSYFIFLMLGVAGVGLFLFTDSELSETRVVETGLVVFGSVGLISTVLVHPRWFAQLSIYVFQYIILGTLVQLGVTFLDASGSESWDWITESLSDPQNMRHWGGWGVLFFVYSIAVVFIAPIQAP